MAINNIGFDVSGDVDEIELNKREDFKSPKNKGKYSYEEALDIAGEGIYNKGLLFTSFMIIVAMGIDIYGLGIIVTAATCDLGMTLSQIGVLSSMPFAGIIVMSYPWGYLSDTRGRKLVLMWSMGCGFVSAVLSSLAPNWQTLAAFRFLSSAMSSAAESATYALLGECCTSKVRARYMLLMTSALMLTPTIYYIAAYLIMKLNFSVAFLGIIYRPWRLLTLIMALPLGIGAGLLYYFSESPKYLVNVGRNKEAVNILTRIYRKNNKKIDGFPVKEIYLEEGTSGDVSKFSLESLWTQIAPIFKPPLLSRTLLLFYLTFVVYIANNSFAIILPTIFNMFFTSLASSTNDASFCDLFSMTVNTTDTEEVLAACEDSINDNTIWAGCAHGLSFFVLNALISQCASRRKILSITILLIAAAAALGVDNTGEPISGLILFYIYLTTAMIFGVISSYFVDLYPTSYRSRIALIPTNIINAIGTLSVTFAFIILVGTAEPISIKFGMVACLGMMVARLSAFAGTNIVGAAMTTQCSNTFYGVSALVISGAVVAAFLPNDKT